MNPEMLAFFNEQLYSRSRLEMAIEQRMQCAVSFLTKKPYRREYKGTNAINYRAHQFEEAYSVLKRDPSLITRLQSYSQNRPHITALGYYSNPEKAQAFIVAQNILQTTLYIPYIPCSIAASDDMWKSPCVEPGVFISDNSLLEDYYRQMLLNKDKPEEVYAHRHMKPCEYVDIASHGYFPNDPFHLNITPYLDELIPEDHYAY